MSERVKAALRNSAQRGIFKESNPPYGYILESRKLQLSPNGTLDIVRRIFRDYISGKGFDGIAKELYEKALPTPGQVTCKKNAS